MSDQRKDAPPQASLPDFQPSAAIGFLRFFVWLTPTGIAVACLFLAGWLQRTYIGPDGALTISLTLGVAGLLACGWFDSLFTIHCRTGRRSTGSHMLMFSLIEIFFIMPAILFATLYAICAAGA